jgi:hypothetical protein
VRSFTRPAPLRREEAGRFRHEASWPAAGVRERVFRLGGGGALVAENAGKTGVESGRERWKYRPDVGIAAGRYVIGQFSPGWGMADDQRLDEALCLTYSTPALGAAAEMVGAPRVVLKYRATSARTMLSAKLCDVAPDGTSVLVTKGLVNLGGAPGRARAIAGDKDGAVRVELPLMAMAYRFEAGHRIRLMIAGADVLNVWPSPEEYECEIFHGGADGSVLSVPMAEGSPEKGALSEPVFLASDFAPLPMDQIPTPRYAVTRDLIRGTLTCEYTTNAGVGVNKSSYTVSLARPAEATVVSGFVYPLERPGASIVVKSECTTRSDAADFHHETKVEVTLNGRVHWAKSWALRVPRAGR